eukprot:2616631-Rhodomonas_salina.1
MPLPADSTCGAGLGSRSSALPPSPYAKALHHTPGCPGTCDLVVNGCRYNCATRSLREAFLREFTKAMAGDFGVCRARQRAHRGAPGPTKVERLCSASSAS